MKYKTTITLICILCNFVFFLFRSPAAIAFSGLQVNVEIIKADKSSTVVDPEIKDLIKELGPVLNYTGFSLIKKSEIRLGSEEKGEVILPAGRILELETLGFENNQARLLAKIVKKDEEIFRTILLMVDNGSVIIGGPPHEGGVLLLRIKAIFTKSQE